MDDMWAQIQCFFVPNRLTCEHWEEIMGENKQGPYLTNKTTYEVPKLAAPSGGWAEKSLADYLGIPTKIGNISVNSLYTKGVAKVFNDWYRDENRVNFANITTGNSNLTGSNGTNQVTDIELGGAIPNVAKAHDLFTSSAIEPQKGPAVLLPLGTTAPVIGNGKALGITYDGTNAKALGATGTGTMRLADNSTIGNAGAYATFSTAFGADKQLGLSTDGTKSGVIADLTKATASSVNELRLALALQQMLEIDAISGTRYTEIIYSHFGIKSPDARLQRSEYLGGKKIPISISQVIQQSESGTTPQGNLAGMSQTWTGDEYFTKSFTEHGILYVFVCVKSENVYQQGLPAKFSKFKRTDYYDPIFANIGMQPIYNRELYAQGSTVVDTNGNVIDDQAFGYKEAWDEYRTFDNDVAGEFRSNATNTLDYWHLAREFSALPTNGDVFIQEGTANLDRALTVASSTADQFQSVFAIGGSITRVMPAHSIPGLRRF